MSKPFAQQLIDHLKLIPLQHEGGYFVETYRSEEHWTGLPTRNTGIRPASTAIYYLLTADTVSRFHRLQSDEIWHFYAGDTVELIMLQPDGQGHVVRLGQHIFASEQYQVIVPRGHWQGARLAPGGEWALMGCTVAPGFTFDDFELASPANLLQQYPVWRPWINALT